MFSKEEDEAEESGGEALEAPAARACVPAVVEE